MYNSLTQKNLVKKITLSFYIVCLLTSSCNERPKNPYDKTKDLDLTTGDFNSQYVELIITNNNSTVLNGCELVNIEMDQSGQKIGSVKKLCSGPWQPKEAKKINLNWDYYNSDHPAAGRYTFSITSEIPDYCDNK